MSASRTVPACPPTPGTGWLGNYYSILLLGWLVEELSGERFSYCPGLPAYTGDRMIRLTDADLKRILLEKYNGTVVLRARDCTRLRDREHAKGSAGLKRHTLSVLNCFADR